MKKLLLIPALLAGTLLFSQQKKVEISPMIGYNLAEGNLDIKDDKYPLYGLEIQFNALSANISPEFSLLYAEGVDYESGQETKIVRGAFNGVYTFDEVYYVVPFAKIGAGFERVTNSSSSVEDGFFLDTGAGVKVPFTDNLAFKFETTYMAKESNLNAGFMDSNLLVMVGLTFAFGEEEKREVPKEEPKPEKVVEEYVAPVPVIVDGDDDNDTVLNSVDECPKTPTGVIVDKKGCDIDTDRDGILNVNDICPNTLFDTTVNSDGCPKTVPLNVNFENNSDVIQDSSDANIQEYADFLTKHTNYHANIIGYTDNVGRESYNQRLSEKRAAMLVKELTARGVNPSQLSSEGAGESNPIADNSTEEGRAKNRRIEAELVRD